VIGVSIQDQACEERRGVAEGEPRFPPATRTDTRIRVTPASADPAERGNHGSDLFLDSGVQA